MSRRKRKRPAKRPANPDRTSRVPTDRDDSGRGVRRHVQTVEAAYSGPLPPASQLAQYGEAVPGAAERILAMAERTEEHFRIVDQGRVEFEQEYLTTQSNLQRRGQMIGAVVVGAALLVCFAALYWGHEQVAMVLGSTTIVALAAVFVIGRLPWFK